MQNFEQQEQQENQAPPVQKTVAPEKLNYLERKRAQKVRASTYSKIEELEQNIVQFEEEIAT